MRARDELRAIGASEARGARATAVHAHAVGRAVVGTARDQLALRPIEARVAEATAVRAHAALVAIALREQRAVVAFVAGLTQAAALPALAVRRAARRAARRADDRARRRHRTTEALRAFGRNRRVTACILEREAAHFVGACRTGAPTKGEDRAPTQRQRLAVARGGGRPRRKRARPAKGLSVQDGDVWQWSALWGDPTAEDQKAGAEGEGGVQRARARCQIRRLHLHRRVVPRRCGHVEVRQVGERYVRTAHLTNASVDPELGAYERGAVALARRRQRAWHGHAAGLGVRPLLRIRCEHVHIVEGRRVVCASEQHEAAGEAGEGGALARLGRDARGHGEGPHARRRVEEVHLARVRPRVPTEDGEDWSIGRARHIGRRVRRAARGRDARPGARAQVERVHVVEALAARAGRATPEDVQRLQHEVRAVATAG